MTGHYIKIPSSDRELDAMSEAEVRAFAKWSLDRCARRVRSHQVEGTGLSFAFAAICVGAKVHPSRVGPPTLRLTFVLPERSYLDEPWVSFGISYRCPDTWETLPVDRRRRFVRECIVDFVTHEADEGLLEADAQLPEAPFRGVCSDHRPGVRPFVDGALAAFGTPHTDRGEIRPKPPPWDAP